MFAVGKPKEKKVINDEGEEMAVLRWSMYLIRSKALMILLYADIDCLPIAGQWTAFHLEAFYALLHSEKERTCVIHCPNPIRRCPRCKERKRMFFTCSECERIACVDACLVMIDNTPYCRDCAVFAHHDPLEPSDVTGSNGPHTQDAEGVELSKVGQMLGTQSPRREAAQEIHLAEGAIDDDLKDVMRKTLVETLGVRHDGIEWSREAPPNYIVRCIDPAMWMITQPTVRLVWMHVLTGRWVCVEQFRHATLSIFSELWKIIANWRGGRRTLSSAIRHEPLCAVCYAPLYYDDLSTPIEGVVTISDASPGDAGVCANLGVTNMGAAAPLRAQETVWHISGEVVILVSLNEGCGARRRAWGLVSMDSACYAALNCDAASRRVISGAWPDTTVLPGPDAVKLGDFEETSRHQVLIDRIVLSASYRAREWENITAMGRMTTLVWPDARRAGMVDVKTCVAESEFQELSEFLGLEALRFCSSTHSHGKRDRGWWHDWPCVEALVRFSDADDHEVLKGDANRWLRQQGQWPSEEDQHESILPTSVRSRLRGETGLLTEATDYDEGTTEHWELEVRTSPLYQCQSACLILDIKRGLVVPDEEEREILQRFSVHHTVPSVSSSKTKRCPRSARLERSALMGTAWNAETTARLLSLLAVRWGLRQEALDWQAIRNRGLAYCGKPDDDLFPCAIARSALPQFNHAAPTLPSPRHRYNDNTFSHGVLGFEGDGWPVFLAAVNPRHAASDGDGERRRIDTLPAGGPSIIGGVPVGIVEPPPGCDPYGFFHEQVRQPDGSFRTIGRWAGMIATRESHPELPSYSPTSANLGSSSPSMGMHVPMMRVRGRPATVERLGIPRDPWHSLLAVASSPTQSPHNSTRGMQVDSDGDFAHGFMIENRRTGLLVRRPSPTISCSGDSISSGDLEGSYGTYGGVRGDSDTTTVNTIASSLWVLSPTEEYAPVELRDYSGDDDNDESGASDNYRNLAVTCPTSQSPSSVPTVQLITRRRRQPTSLVTTRMRRSPLPSPVRHRSPTRSPSCLSVLRASSSDSVDIMDL